LLCYTDVSKELKGVEALSPHGKYVFKGPIYSDYKKRINMDKNRFGYEWSQYPKIIPLYETQFKAWTSPIAENEWLNKSVLDAGCGTGRNSQWPLQYGAKEIVAFDIDPRTVDVARRNLSRFSNCEIIQKSIYDLTWENKFDISFSIGVIHHLDNPKKAVKNLVRAVKPGGKILIWVYGKEGHSRLKATLNWIRKCTCRIPLPILNLIVYPFSLLWWSYMRFLPHKHPYLKQFRRAHVWHVHSILFDQLLPDIVNYWTRDEAIDLFSNLDIKDIQTEWINKGSWTVCATKV